jgi:hypothetical protein
MILCREPSWFFCHDSGGIHLQMRHPEVRWNRNLQEWFCVRCGRTSDDVVYDDAQTELGLFECELPALAPSTEPT